MVKAALCLAITVLCSIFELSNAVVRHRSTLPSLQPPPGPWSSCKFTYDIDFGDLCRCRGSIADCSGAKFKVIPFFNQSVTMLLFSFNELGPGLYGYYIKHLPDLTHLDVSHNAIVDVDPFLAIHFHRIRVLDVSGNFRELHTAHMVIESVANIEELDVSFSNQPGFPRQFMLFPLPPLSKLRILRLNFYNFERINMTMLKQLDRLRELSIVGIQSTNVEFYPDHLPHLEKLDLRDNNLRLFILTCYDVNLETGPTLLDSFFPNLSSFDMSGNLIGRTYTEPFRHERCLPQLRNLSLERSMYKEIRTGEFSRRLNGLNRYPKLQHLSLKAAGSEFILEPFAFNNSNLLTLDLSVNRLYFASERISSQAFGGCTNLSELNLEWNFLRKTSELKFQRLFAPLKSLRVLNLGGTRLENISGTFFRTLKNVKEFLLNDNLITAVPDGTFDELNQLEVLRLDDNQISLVSESTFSSDTRRRLTSLNLSHNPFECTCSLLWFRQWLVSQPELFDLHNPYSRYECSNIPGKHLADFLQNEQPCLLGHDAYVFVVVCSTLLISILILGSQVYRYRWHIRLVLYEAFRGHPEARQRQRRPEDLQFDLFVSYDSEDVQWVVNHLIPVLEQQMGLRLCVHQRDFIPGKNITDNILDCLDASKRILAVFSPNFAESHWCNFELEMCLSHVIDNNDVMVIVILQHIPARDMSGAMLALTNTTTYIEWGEHPETVASFWRRLTIALKDILPGCRQ